MPFTDLTVPEGTTALYLAFDPGEVTGWAAWDQNGEFILMGQVPWEDLPFWWEANVKIAVRAVIIEEYVLFGKRAKQQTGSRMKASQAIGMIKAMTSRTSAEVIEQKSSIKAIAVKQSQIAMPSNHNISHQFDAYLHGYYYLVKEGIILTELEKQKAAERANRENLQG